MTPTEARISAVVGTVFSLLIVAAIFEEYSPRKLSVFFILLLWIPMLVLHELGHAVTARLLGWDVREMVIGFGRTLWQFHVGGTRIRIKLAPVEGYVLPAANSARFLRAKSMAIYAAGPGAELLLLGIIVWFTSWDTVFSNSDSLASIALQSLAIVIIYSAGFNLLPFRSDGAVSDGLGIISSPFISAETIELRLLTVELREIRTLQAAGKTDRALALARQLLQRFPDNRSLQYCLAAALAADGQDDEAREAVRNRLADDHLPDPARREWLLLQAQVELDAAQPSNLVLDLALQKARAMRPQAPDAMAIKGASMVMRGDYLAGGNLLADAWRRNDGSADDSQMLAYLTIAAAAYGNDEAHAHFLESFRQVNRSSTLERRVQQSGAAVIG